MKLVDMKADESATKDAVCSYPGSPYPYGLRLTLNAEQLAALGHEGLPPAGTWLRIEAKGCVTRSASEDPDADGDIDYLCVDVQITQMGMEEEVESGDEEEGEKTRASRMYGKKEAQAAKG